MLFREENRADLSKQVPRFLYGCYQPLPHSDADRSRRLTHEEQ